MFGNPSRRFLSCVLAVVGLGLTIGTSQLWAQDFRALIIGQVTDPTGAGVPNATITAVKPDTSQSFSTKTNAGGAYSLPYLLPGVYNVTAEAAGFKKALRESVTLAVAEKHALDFQLELGAVTQEITVSAHAEVLETSTASGGTVFDPEKTQSLPLNGRQSYMLLQLAAGVMFTQKQFGAQGFSGTRGWDVNGSYTMNGGWTGENQFLLNGAPISVNGSWQLAPNVDAIQEFKVMTNTYDAQYGRTGGGTVNTTLKAGTNAIHGTLFDYHRNSALDANTFTSNLANGDRGKHIVNQWGGTVGGPIRKNKTFYYGSFEGWREVVPFPRISSTIPANLRPRADGSVDFSQSGFNIYDPKTTRCVQFNAQGQCSKFARDQFPGNVIPANRISPTGLAILKLYPLPNAPGDVRNFFVTNNLGRYAYNQPMARVDHNFNDNNRMYALFTWQRGHEDRNNNGFQPPAQIGNIVSERDDTNIVLDFTHTFSPSMLGDLRFSFGRFHQRFPDGERDFDFTADKLGLTMPSIPTTDRKTAPRIKLDRYEDVIGNNFSDNGNNHFDLAPSIAHTLGRHTLHYGGEFVLIQFFDPGVGRPHGMFTFGPTFTQQDPFRRNNDGSGVASLLLGHPNNCCNDSSFVEWNNTMFEGWHYYAGYVQDDFRVRKNLTLNLGLRWDVQTSVTERFNRINAGFCFTCANPIDAKIDHTKFPILPNPLRGGLLFAGVDGAPRATYNNYLNQWQPRLGIAWSITPKTVLRGGFGLYYSFGDQHNTRTGFAQRTDYITSLDGGLTPNPAFNTGNPYPNGAAPPTGSSLGFATSLGRGVSFDLATRRVPRVREWSFGIQRELPGHILLDTAYVGSYTDRRTLNTQWDVISEADRARGQADPAFLNTNVPNPFFGVLPANSTLGASATIQRWRLLRSVPEFDGVTEFTNPGSKVSYHGLQVRGEKRVGGEGPGRGLTFILSYTYSKDFEQNHFLNNGSFRDDIPIREISFFDRTHNLAFSGVWNLPVGQGGIIASGATGVWGALLSHWAFDWIFTHAGGTATGIPDADFSCSSYAAPNRTFGQWFNNDRSCYSQRKEWTKRVVPDRVSYIRDPHEPQLSVALQKQFRMTERMRVQGRVEAFNVLNTPIFPGPSTDFTQTPRQLSNGNFTGLGTVNLEQQNFPRNIQVSLKLIF